MELSNHCFSISINGLRLPSPSFADEISLLALHPSFFQTFMNIFLIMVYDGDANLIIQRVALSPSVKQNLSILFL